MGITLVYANIMHTLLCYIIVMLFCNRNALCKKRWNFVLVSEHTDESSVDICWQHFPNSS